MRTDGLSGDRVARYSPAEGEMERVGSVTCSRRSAVNRRSLRCRSIRPRLSRPRLQVSLDQELRRLPCQ